MAKPVPGWIDKVNYIIDFWVDPCHAPAIVYIELLKAPVGHALLTWFSFGLDDILRGYLRPSKALGSRGWTRRGKVKGKRTTLFRYRETIRGIVRKVPGLGDDLGNWIGKHLPGAEAIKGREISQATRFMWILDDLGQRALLALLIVDVATDFLYEWATLVNDTEYCKRDHTDSLYATGPGVASGGVFICNPADHAVTQWSTGAVTWSGNLGNCGPGHHTAVSSMKLQNIGTIPCTHTQRITIDDEAGHQVLDEAVQTIAPGATADSVATVKIVGTGHFSVLSCTSPGITDCSVHDVAIWGGSLV